MCRLLCIRAEKAFAIEPHLEVFSEIARTSREYQGHGWGCAWLEGGQWRLYHSIEPIWEDARPKFGETTLLLAHARSAFRDEGIRVENNMPFSDGTHVFIFNGELRGVRIKAQGRIGAEKVFNTIKRFHKGDLLEALRRGLRVIDKRTRYVRALNLIMASREQVYLASVYNEDPGYFQMHQRESNGLRLVCSQGYPGETGWLPIESGTLATLGLAKQ